MDGKKIIRKMNEARRRALKAAEAGDAAGYARWCREYSSAALACERHKNMNRECAQKEAREKALAERHLPIDNNFIYNY